MTIGNFLDYYNHKKELNIRANSKDIISNWNKCDLIVKFIYKYYQQLTERKVKDDFSFVINELLENAVKYSNNKPIECAVFEESGFVITVINYTNKEQTMEFIKHLKNCYKVPFDINNSFKETNKAELGYVLLIQEFHLPFSFKIQRDNSDFKISVQTKI